MTPVLRKITAARPSTLALSCGHQIKAAGAVGGWVACPGCAAGKAGR